MKTLFDSFKLGEITLKNRIVMSPLTRSRSGPERIPNDLMVEYYVQRSTAGLIITEATSISPRGVGYADTPGIWSDAQVQGWKKVVDAVHANDGKIVMQLWHVGRISDPMFLNGALPVAPSAIAPDGFLSLVRPQKHYEIPHALTIPEIKEIIEDYRKAAANAKKAGFDGVEIHGANGYLPDQFLQTGANHRTDEYGGPIENRARFLLEVTDAVISVWGASRVGVHLAPRASSNISDHNPKETFTYVARELRKRDVAFLFVREKQGDGYLSTELKKEFGGGFIANEGLTAETAEQLINANHADLVSFGKLYISNPDLVSRFKNKSGLTEPDFGTLYAQGATGYTDYPSLKHDD